MKIISQNKIGIAVSKVEGGLIVKDKFDKRSKHDRPLVSIITVCLNSERHLEQTIQSVINQSYHNIEYIIVDGGSKDRTLDIIKKYENNIAYWVSEPDRGIFDAMNKGVSLATGELVGIINSDDWYLSDTVETVVDVFKEDSEANVFFGNMFLVEENKSVEYKEYKGTTQAILDVFRVNHPTCFVKKDVYENHKFKINLKTVADYELILQLYFSGIKFHSIDKPLAYFRIGGACYRYYSTWKVCFDKYKIRKKYNRLKALHYLLRSLIEYQVKPFILRKFFSDNIDHKFVKFYRRLREICEYPKQ